MTSPINSLTFSTILASALLLSACGGGGSGSTAASQTTSSGGVAASSKYAGNWNGAYSGGGTGTCQLFIDNNGVMSGTCASSSGSFNIVGQIDNSGNISFHLQVGNQSGATFTGQAASTTRLNGYWASGNYNGIWYFDHV